LPHSEIKPSEILSDELLQARKIPHLSEKARSEWLVVPL
jgi:hypothetical protein